MTRTDPRAWASVAAQLHNAAHAAAQVAGDRDAAAARADPAGAVPAGQAPVPVRSDVAAASPAGQDPATAAPPLARATRRGVPGAEERRAARALRLAWGGAYDIGFADGAWRACRLDGSPFLLTGTTPDQLTASIRADWARRSAR